MILLLHRFHGLMVKLFLYSAALTSMIIQRICAVGDAPSRIADESLASPQQMLVRMITLMIATSLTMLSRSGYSSPPRGVRGQLP